MSIIDQLVEDISEFIYYDKYGWFNSSIYDADESNYTYIMVWYKERDRKYPAILCKYNENYGYWEDETGSRRRYFDYWKPIDLDDYPEECDF